MENHSFYSQRKGTNPNQAGLPLRNIVDLTFRMYTQFRKNGYFDEAFGFYCVDLGNQSGAIGDIELDILIKLRKDNIWPIESRFEFYSEDDLFDLIEYLFGNISKPVDGTYHSWNDCGMHWKVFDKEIGQREFLESINGLLVNYINKFQLTEGGFIVEIADIGLEPIFNAQIKTSDENVIGRLESSRLRFRRHGASIDERRQAVRDLADVLEYLRKDIKDILSKDDEKDLFNIANNFGIRHMNDKQKTDYDGLIWLSWMFYFYYSTILALLNKKELGNSNKQT